MNDHVLKRQMDEIAFSVASQLLRDLRLMAATMEEGDTFYLSEDVARDLVIKALFEFDRRIP